MARVDRESTSRTGPSAASFGPLERRLMFTTILLSGTAGNDTIEVTVQGGLVVTDVNGTVTVFSDAEVTGILINALGGDDEVAIESNGDNPTTVNGGDGFDNIWLAPGAQDLDNIDSTVLVNGGAGFDFLSFFDANQTRDVAFSVLGTTVSRAGAPTVPHLDVEMLRVNTGSGSDTVHVNTARIVRLDTGPGTDTIDVIETGAGGMSIAPTAGDDVVRVNTDGVGTARVQLTAQRIDSLTIGPGGHTTILEALDTDVLVTRSLSLSGTAVLDANEDHVVIDYTGPSPLAAIRAAVTSGYAGGAWNGPGIHSQIAGVTGNTALGYAEATELFTTFPATFDGVQVDDSAVLIRHTRYGDADLSGIVDLNDFNRLASHFGQVGRPWALGDFDYNGVVNMVDFNRLAANFGRTAQAASATAGSLLDDREEADEDVIGLR